MPPADPPPADAQSLASAIAKNIEAIEQLVQAITGQREPSLLIDGPEVCRRLSIGRDLFHRMRREGQFPLQPTRLSGRVLFSAAELAAWCAAKCPGVNVWRLLNQNQRKVG